MGSGRGDRNQVHVDHLDAFERALQWGPVVVTGIRVPLVLRGQAEHLLQWGPVVVTGIS